VCVCDVDAWSVISLVTYYHGIGTFWKKKIQYIHFLCSHVGILCVCVDFVGVK